MPKKKKPTFIAERRICTSAMDADFINNKLYACNRMYNNGVKHYIPLVKQLRKDAWFNYSVRKWREARNKTDDPENDPACKEWSGEVNLCIRQYGLSEYDIHTWFGAGKVSAMEGCLGINVVQKVGTALYSSIKKAIFNGTEIHFRKFGQTDSMEDKKASSGIIYNGKNGTVKIFGRVMKLKPVRKKDVWMQEALTHKVKYCRVVRRAYDGRYKYFLQIVLEGTAPEKLIPGKEETCLYPGTSTMVTYGGHTDFSLLAPDVKKYEKDVRYWSTVYERRRRMANPQNYHPDGQIRKDTAAFHKVWNHTKGMDLALMHLKSAYRLKAEYVKQYNHHLANDIIEASSSIRKEPMDYRALARRAKETSRRDKAEAVKKKDGTVKMVHKFKRKKRFGTSIGRYSPAAFIRDLTAKCGKYKLPISDCDTQKMKPSQFNHVTGEFIKPGLSDRKKEVGGFMVQRDLYAAFLDLCSDGTTVSIQACMEAFPEFLKRQADVIWNFLLSGRESSNFGMDLNDIRPVDEPEFHT